MELSRPPLVVAFELSAKRKAIVADALAGASAVVYLTELDDAARAEALRNTGALLTFNTSKELRLAPGVDSPPLQWPTFPPPRTAPEFAVKPISAIARQVCRHSEKELR
jgi:hypothetical protein